MHSAGFTSAWRSSPKPSPHIRKLTADRLGHPGEAGIRFGTKDLFEKRVVAISDRIKPGNRLGVCPVTVGACTGVSGAVGSTALTCYVTSAPVVERSASSGLAGCSVQVACNHQCSDHESGSQHGEYSHLCHAAHRQPPLEERCEPSSSALRALSVLIW